MSAMQHIRFYERGGSFTATRNFDLGDVAIVAGAAFDWQKLGLPETKVVELWNAYYIEGVRPEAKPAEPPKATHGARPQKQR